MQKRRSGNGYVGVNGLNQHVANRRGRCERHLERGHGRGLHRGKRVIQIGQWFTSAKGFVSTCLRQKARRGGIWKSYGQARPVSRHRRMRLRRLGQTSNLCIGVFTYDTTNMTHSKHTRSHLQTIILLVTLLDLQLAFLDSMLLITLLQPGPLSPHFFSQLPNIRYSIALQIPLNL